MTKFHSGRIRVIFAPTASTNVTPFLEDQSLTYNWIVDLSDSTTWKINIPYVSVLPWRNRENREGGSIFFIVETPLVVTGGASSTVDLCLFVQPGEDFEVAVPNLEPNTKMYLAPVAARTTLDGTYDYDMVEAHADIIPLQDSTLSTDAHNMTIGDPVRSLRSVLKKFCKVRPIVDNNAYVFYPFPLTPRSSPNNSQQNELDMVAAISACYTFFRGGMRYVINGYGVQEVTFYEHVSEDRFYSNARNGVEEVGNFADSVAPSIVFGPTEPCKFELPYTSRFPAVNIHKIKPSSRLPVTSRVAAKTMTGAAYTYVSRAVADDFDMGFLIGPPFIIS